jgi:hypothetical protein
MINHLRQRLPQGMPGLPSQQPAGMLDVQFILVVSQVDHPRFDERLIAGKDILQPGSGFGQRLGNLLRFPFLAMNQAAKRAL